MLGNTWLVNAIIISGVLTMILLANVIVLRWPRIHLGPVYMLLLATVFGLYFLDLARFAFLAYPIKAAVVGAYERGERSLSLPRLQRLAQFFQVPIAQFLPQEEDGERTLEPLPSGGITIDLNRLERMSGTEAVIFNRFLRSIQMMRQDFNGKVLTIRRDDLRLLALLLDQPEEAFNKRLIELGLTTDTI